MSVATHLSDQHYKICFRREANRCALCVTPSQQDIAPASFGLSNDPATEDNTAQGTICSLDYITVRTHTCTVCLHC